MITLESTQIIQDDSPISRTEIKPFLQIREHSQVPETNAWDILGAALPYTIFFSVQEVCCELFLVFVLHTLKMKSVVLI